MWQSQVLAGTLSLGGSVPEELGTDWAWLLRIGSADVANAAIAAPLKNLRRAIMLPPFLGRSWSLLVVPRSVRLRAQEQFLHPPVGRLGHVDLVLRRAGDLMAARELLEGAAGLSDHAQHLAFERHLEQPSREGRFADKHDLVRARRNADR